MRRLVLIVEDDPALQRGMADQLERMDFDVTGALHYDDAVERLTARTPHLVCINLELPTRSGYELCEHIRGPLRLARVPILVTSNSGFPHALAHAEEAGANAFLKKPFSLDQFRTSVEALLGRKNRRIHSITWSSEL